MANIQIKVDDSLRDNAQFVASQIGLDVATAVRMFLVQMVKVNGLPFQPIADPYYSPANQRYLERAALSRKPATWDDFFAALKDADVPADFLDTAERNQGAQDRDPFVGWRE
ncbi:MAG: type II toxin-antitoxin system RelB/DinJ family antitoxin [Syntrophorhabdaceae bacterium]|nr:type II toxin-antitoxin system RelB/DinJ family antitoxin [Syntrophorhabdaceae bacterium]